MELLPRTRTVMPEPGRPLVCWTWTPATLPWIRPEASETGRRAASSVETMDTAVVRSFLRTEP